MNRTKIEWTDYSWNPITGCKHGCWYCYAKKLTQRFKKIFPNGFEPTFYPERLHEPYYVKKPSKIFVCSIADLFAEWTPLEWRDAVLTSIEHCPIPHTFQLLTKQPHLIPKDYYIPQNVWVGATVTKQDEITKIDDLGEIIGYGKRFISFEPLLGEIDCDLTGIHWIIIGKLTGSKKVQLQDEWVNKLFKEARKQDIPVFMKNNLIDTYKGLYWMQEFPSEIK